MRYPAYPQEALMSLKRIRIVFYLAVIVLAVTIDCIGGNLGWIVAAIMLGGSIPMFRSVTRAAEHRGINDYRRLRRANARHILSTDQAELDVREVGR